MTMNSATSATMPVRSVKTRRLNWDWIMALVGENFARNLSALLDKYSRRPIDLARAINVSPSTVNGWMTGRIEPKLSRLDEIADFFKVSYLELIRPEAGWTADTPKPSLPRDLDTILRELAASRGYELRPKKS